MKLEKNWVTFYLRVGILCLCCCHSSSVRSLKVLNATSSPSSFSRTNSTLLKGALILFSYRAAVMEPH